MSHRLRENICQGIGTYTHYFAISGTHISKCICVLWYINTFIIFLELGALKSSMKQAYPSVPGMKELFVPNTEYLFFYYLLSIPRMCLST